MHDKVQLLLDDHEHLTVEDVAELYDVTEDEARTHASYGVHRIQVALVIDRYLEQSIGVDRKQESAYGESPQVVNKVDRRVSFLSRIFGVSVEGFRKVMKREKYEAWRQRTEVDVSYDQVLEFIRG